MERTQVHQQEVATTPARTAGPGRERPGRGTRAAGPIHKVFDAAIADLVISGMAEHQVARSGVTAVGRIRRSTFADHVSPVRVIRREPFTSMRSNLVAASHARKSNESYLALLRMLDDATAAEASAVTGDDFQALLDAIADMRPYIQGAVSTKKSVKKDRNDALAALGAALDDKEVELRGKIAMDAVSEDIVEHEIGEGPKAGFEFEYSGTWILDVSKASPFVKRWLGAPDTSPPKLDALRYAKRAVLFSGPHGTWEGTADTSLKACSNLEIVTKPLTAGEWSSEEVAEDHKVLAEFVSALERQPVNALILPRQLHPQVKLHEAGARLMRRDRGRGQTQMTYAAPVRANPASVPDWWIAGLNWNAVPYIDQIVRALESKSFQGGNPKRAFRLFGQDGVIVKSPIVPLLGRPTEEPQPKPAQTWVEGMAALLKVNLEARAAEPLVGAAKATGKKHVELKRAEFTYGDYLDGLLKGRDEVKMWAADAFGGVEDLGLEQIEDPTLDAKKYVIEEHREEFEPLPPSDYLKQARLWAATLDKPDSDRGRTASSNTGKEKEELH